MGSWNSTLGKNSIEMNVQFFALLLLLVLAVNGAPQPPEFFAGPKPPMTRRSNQMKILLPGYGLAFDSYGNDISGKLGPMNGHNWPKRNGGGLIPRRESTGDDVWRIPGFQ